MWNMTFALTAGEMTWGDRASTAGIVTLQGMLTIFVVLAILWGAIELMHCLLQRNKQENSAPKSVEEKANNNAPNTDDAAVAAAIAAALAASEDDGATVAAITAAISAMRAEQGITDGFRVVSFKRANPANRRRF